MSVPTAPAVGPDPDRLGTTRVTHAFFTDGSRHCYEDDWQGRTANIVLKPPWTGMPIFTTSRAGGRVGGSSRCPGSRARSG